MTAVTTNITTKATAPKALIDPSLIKHNMAAKPLHKKKQKKKKKICPILVTFALLYILSEVLILFRAKQTPWLSGIISNMLQKWQDFLEYVSERFILRSYWEPRLWRITSRTYNTK